MRIYPTIKKVIQAAQEAVSSFIVSNVKPGIAVSSQNTLQPTKPEANVGIAVAQTDPRLVVDLKPGIDTDLLGATIDASKPSTLVGVAASQVHSLTPAKPEANVGVDTDLLGATLTAAKPQASVGVDTDLLAAVVTASKPSTLVGLTADDIRIGQSPGALPPGAPTQQVPAFDIVQITYNFTTRVGADAAANLGPDNWTNPNNATGLNGSGNGNATSAGEALNARTRSLQLGYPNFPNKGPLTISTVRLHFYVEQAGTALNNGDLRLRYNVGGGLVTLETITGNVSNLNSPRTFDITAAVGGSWTNLDALIAQVEHRTDAAENLITAAVNAVEVEIISSATQIP